MISAIKSLQFIFLIIFVLEFQLILIKAGEPNPNSIFPLVTTSLGQLRGQAVKSLSGRWYYAFRGIPYGQPPQRFRPAELVEPWEGLKDARSFGSPCPHINGSMGFIGDEDCLFMNIYFPHYHRCQNDLTPGGQLPVLVFIHGGSYTNGAGSIFGMNFLLDECIVVVTFNYRQGALGFLTTDDGLIPGNLGLKDQNLALKWIQNNIEYFRGDPNLVTLMGCSSGASAVSHHVASTASNGLFHRAITQSGTILSPWSVVEKPEVETRVLAEMLNCSLESTASIKSCLELANVVDIVSNQISSPFQPTPFAPVIELNTTENPFQTMHPVQRLENGDFNKVPMISGFVENEYYLEDPLALAVLNNYWLQVVPLLFMFDQLGMSQDEMDVISTKIRAFYLNDQVIDSNTRQNLTNMLSDRFFVQGVFETVQFHSKFAPVFPYVLTYKGGQSRGWNNEGFEIPMVTHGDDEQYFFGWEVNYGTEQFEFTKKLIKYWTTFARYGKPDLSSEVTSWQPASQDSANNIWRKLDLPEENLINFLNDRRQFWTELGLYEAEWNFGKV